MLALTAQPGAICFVGGLEDMKRLTGWTLTVRIFVRLVVATVMMDRWIGDCVSAVDVEMVQAGVRVDGVGEEALRDVRADEVVQSWQRDARRGVRGGPKRLELRARPVTASFVESRWDPLAGFGGDGAPGELAVVPVRGVPPSVTRDDVIVHRVVVQGISARGERPQRVYSGGCVPRHAPYQHGARGFGSEERRADLAVRVARREIRVRRRGEDDPG